MESLYVLIPVSLVLVGLAGGVLVWAIRSGQYDGIEEIEGKGPDADPPA